MENNQKGIAPIIIALIVAVVLGGGYFIVKAKGKSSPKVENTTQAQQNNSGIVKDNIVETFPTAASTIVTTKSSEVCTNSTCFMNAIEACSTAQYQTDSQTELLGSNIKSKIRFEVSQSNNRCLLGINLLAYNISPSQGLLDSMKGGEVVGPGPDEIYPKLNKEMQEKYVGKKGICDITNEKTDIIINLFKTNSEVALITTPNYNVCSGELFVKFNFTK